MLNSSLPPCTANSIRAAVPRESMSAVSSIRPLHRWSGLCIPTGDKLVQYTFRTVLSMVIEILTLQTYKRWRSCKVGQIMLIEYAFDLDVKERWVTMLILQLHLDVAPELIVLREHRYHRDLKNLPCQSQFSKLQFDVPSLAGQMASKCFKSSPGRTLSIGMQYLNKQFVKFLL
jgi:hypothetical protein